MIGLIILDSIAIGNRKFYKNNFYTMGILNITPDSFYDGGVFFDEKKAIFRAEEIIKQGADIVDVGGESTRPGYKKIEINEELERVIKIISKIKKSYDVLVSIDTTKSQVAEEAFKNGADMLNDISCLKDKNLANIVAKYDKSICIQHNRENLNYKNFLNDVLNDLKKAIKTALKSGIRKNKIIIDPGIGFAKNLEQNFIVLKNLDKFKKLGYFILIGNSRKKFLRGAFNLDVDQRLPSTLAINSYCFFKKINFIRVHDVLEHSYVCDLLKKIIF
ncbi:MAG: dihydropteroate synthase [Clostridiales bacterium]|nr:dihydropteroate synthase [Clostridiales bacterium]